MSIGDVRTKNILVTKEGELKIVNVASFPSERTSIQKVLENYDTSTIFYFGNLDFIQHLKRSNMLCLEKQQRLSFLIQKVRHGVLDFVC